MEISEAWLDTYDEWYMASIPTWSHLQKSLAVAEPEFKDILPWISSHLLNDHEDCPNQHENRHNLCNETRQPIVNLMESQWKLGQQHDQNLPMEEKPL